MSWFTTKRSGRYGRYARALTKSKQLEGELSAKNNLNPCMILIHRMISELEYWNINRLIASVRYMNS